MNKHLDATILVHAPIRTVAHIQHTQCYTHATEHHLTHIYIHDEYGCPDKHVRISLINVPKLHPWYISELGLPPLCRATGTNIPSISFNTGDPDDPPLVPLLYSSNGPTYTIIYSCMYTCRYVLRIKQNF